MCGKNSLCLACQKSNEKKTRVVGIVEDKQFVQAVSCIYIFKQYPNKYPCNKQLLTERYETKLKTYALNELLGRPVPNVVHVGAILAQAKVGRFEMLDATLGFVDNEEVENEMPLEQQMKMNDIMINILKSQGLDFNEIIAVTAKIKLQKAKLVDKEKKKIITKLKLKNQQKLGNVEKPEQSPSESKMVPAKETNDSGKIKTAKDFEHYRKTKRPNRI